MLPTKRHLPGLLLMTVLLASPGHARADCLQPAPSAGLVVTMEDAEAAYGHLDIDAFDTAMAQGATLVPCLDGVLSPSQAARYHRLQGLRAWLVRDQDRASAAFLAARIIEPGYRFPTALVPQDHPTRQVYLSLPADSVLDEPVDVPLGARLVVDGRATQSRPTNVPAVVQLQDTAGSLRWSRYLWSGDSLPSWPSNLAQPTHREHAWRVPLLATAAGAAFVSGALYGAAAVTHHSYQDPTTPVGQLDGLRALNNGLLVGSAGTGGLAIIAGTGAAWTFR